MCLIYQGRKASYTHFIRFKVIWGQFTICKSQNSLWKSEWFQLTLCCLKREDITSIPNEIFFIKTHSMVCVFAFSVCCFTPRGVQEFFTHVEASSTLRVIRWIIKKTLLFDSGQYCRSNQSETEEINVLFRHFQVSHGPT